MKSRILLIVDAVLLLITVFIGSFVYPNLNTDIEQNKKVLKTYTQKSNTEKSSVNVEDYIETLNKDVENLSKKLSLLTQNDDEEYIKDILQQYVEAVYNYIGYRRENQEKILKKIKPIVSEIFYKQYEDTFAVGVGNGNAKEEKNTKDNFYTISEVAVSSICFSDRLNIATAEAVLKIENKAKVVYLKFSIERQDRENQNWQISYTEQLCVNSR